MTSLKTPLHPGPSLESFPKVSPLTASLLILLLIAVFSGIANQVMHGKSLTVLDVHIANWLHLKANPMLTSVVLLFTHLNGITAVSIWALLFCIYLGYKRQRYWLTTTVIAVAGIMALNVIVKMSFQRARPVFSEPLLTLSTYSFPSGHTAGSTVLYGLIATYLIMQAHSLPTKISILSGAIAMISLVGLSRMYLGVHFLSDIAGALVEGCAWLTFVLLAMSMYRQKTLVLRKIA